MKPRPTPSTWECRVALPSEWSSALQCWHERLNGADIFDVHDFQLMQGAYPARGFWIALMDERIDAAIWLWPESNMLAHVWALRVDASLEGESRTSCTLQLWSAAAAHFQSQGIKVFQSLVPISQQNDLAMMLQLGFQQIASIERRQLALGAFSPGDVSQITLESWDNTRKAEFDRFMEQTLIDSQDVPELNSLQTGGEIRTQDDDNSYDRYLIRHQTRGVVGVLVLQADDIQGLIRYIGLIPEARQCGLGLQAAGLAIGLLQSRSCEFIELRVDERNLPAIRLYDRLGFKLMTREHMLIYR